MDTSFLALMESLDRERPILIQTHDFPDHDAIGSAYALRELLQRNDFTCSITFGGLLQSISLTSMIERLEIQIVPFESVCGDLRMQTIIVDGSPAAGTVKIIAGTLVGIIDHHPAQKQVPCPFVDLRVDVGSCSAIIWTYWQTMNETPDKTTATALLAGIQLDTDFLSRRVSKTDLEAHYNLFFLGDSKMAREIVRTSLSVDQLANIGHAFSSVLIQDSILLTEVHGNYTGELLSVLADFLLRLKEITFVVVIEVIGQEYHLSARTRDSRIDTGHIIRETISGMGTGGGHPHMAGGIIDAGRYPGAEKFLQQIANKIASYRSTNETDGTADSK